MGFNSDALHIQTNADSKSTILNSITSTFYLIYILSGIRIYSLDLKGEFY